MITYQIEKILFNKQTNDFLIYLSYGVYQKKRFDIKKIDIIGNILPIHNLIKEKQKNLNIAYYKKTGYEIVNNMRICYFKHISIRLMRIKNKYFYNFIKGGKVLNKINQTTVKQCTDIFQLCSSYWEMDLDSNITDKSIVSYLNNIFFKTLSTRIQKDFINITQ